MASPKGYWYPLVEAQIDGAAHANTTTGASLLPAAARLKIPGGFLDKVGMQLKLIAAGRISTVVTTPGTYTFEFRLGPTSNIIVANGGAMTLSTTAKTNVAWYLEWILTLRAIGGSTSANFMHQGIWTSEAAGATTVAGEAKTIMLPQSAPAVGTGFDSTVDNIADLQGDWSVANAANTLTLHQYSLHALGN
jgi:hypothetical protein